MRVFAVWDSVGLLVPMQVVVLQRNWDQGTRGTSVPINTHTVMSLCYYASLYLLISSPMVPNTEQFLANHALAVGPALSQLGPSGTTLRAAVRAWKRKTPRAAGFFGGGMLVTSRRRRWSWKNCCSCRWTNSCWSCRCSCWSCRTTNATATGRWRSCSAGSAG